MTDRKENDFTESAKQYYKYNNQQATLYTQYRKLGYSDVEARFECEPAFGKWLQLNPSRNVAAVFLGVLPFLGGCLYGLWRTQKAKSRNAKLGKGEVCYEEVVSSKRSVAR